MDDSESGLKAWPPRVIGLRSGRSAVGTREPSSYAEFQGMSEYGWGDNFPLELFFREQWGMVGTRTRGESRETA